MAIAQTCTNDGVQVVHVRQRQDRRRRRCLYVIAELAEAVAKSTDDDGMLVYQLAS